MPVSGINVFPRSSRPLNETRRVSSGGVIRKPAGGVAVSPGGVALNPGGGVGESPRGVSAMSYSWVGGTYGFPSASTKLVPSVE